MPEMIEKCPGSRHGGRVRCVLAPHSPDVPHQDRRGRKWMGMQTKNRGAYEPPPEKAEQGCKHCWHGKVDGLAALCCHCGTRVVLHGPYLDLDETQKAELDVFMGDAPAAPQPMPRRPYQPVTAPVSDEDVDD